MSNVDVVRISIMLARMIMAAMWNIAGMVSYNVHCKTERASEFEGKFKGLLEELDRFERDFERGVAE